MDKVFAALMLLGALLLLLRLALGERRRDALARIWRRGRDRVRRRWRSPFGEVSAERSAERMAQEAIRRARERGLKREGNVLTPKSFRKRKDRDLH